MSKALEMTRSELVWETRVCTFDTQDWTRIIDWLKSFLTSADAKDPFTWYGRHAYMYEVLKDLTFDEVIADYEKYRNGDDDCIKLTFKTKYYDSDEISEYQEELGYLLEEWIREDCCDADVCDWQYADDSEERIEIIELEYPVNED